jgi:hypothetical protein
LYNRGQQQTKGVIMTRHFIDIKFEIDGIADVEQTVRLYDECNLSKKEIVEGLNNGDVLTSINTNGELIQLKDGTFIRLGRIIACEINGDLDYINFELDGDDDY